MENNKLIAEFMELPTEVFNSGILNYYFKDFNSGTWYEEHELSYNFSWDWLIPVVEKIESLRDVNGNAYRFTIDMCNAQIEETNIEILGGAFKLDTTYDAVVQFIKNYKKTNNMEYTEEQQELMYIEYFNNYLTIDVFAEHHQISREEAGHILNSGRLINHSKYK